MIFNIEKFSDIERIRNGQVLMVEYPNLLYIGGKGIEGNHNSLQLWNLLEKKSVPMNLQKNQNFNCLRRTGHVCIVREDNIYVIGGNEPFQNSVVKINKTTWNMENYHVPYDLIHHVVAFHQERQQFLIFTCNIVYYFTTEFDYVDKCCLSPRLFHNQKNFKGILHGDWFYLFGGYNGISFQKRFFRFHVTSHEIENLPTIPNGGNLRISGVEIFVLKEKIYFIMNMCSLSKHNFLYIYDLYRSCWENHYILKHESHVEFVDVHKDNRMELGLKTGMKTYGSFSHGDFLYVFGNDAIFFDYPTVIYRIQIPKEKRPVPSICFDDEECFDFRICLENKTFHCHRYVLMKYSRYFRTLFHSSYHDKYVDEINIEEIDPVYFSMILKYMYFYPLFKIESRYFEAIIPLADYLQMDSLLYDIETSIIQQNKSNITDSNWLTLFPRYSLFLKRKQKP